MEALAKAGQIEARIVPVDGMFEDCPAYVSESEVLDKLLPVSYTHLAEKKEAEKTTEPPKKRIAAVYRPQNSVQRGSRPAGKANTGNAAKTGASASRPAAASAEQTAEPAKSAAPAENRDGQRSGYQGNRDGQRSGGYQGNRDGQRSGGYQGNRDGQRSGGYQGGRDGCLLYTSRVCSRSTRQPDSMMLKCWINSKK